MSLIKHEKEIDFKNLALPAVWCIDYNIVNLGVHRIFIVVFNLFVFPLDTEVRRVVINNALVRYHVRVVFSCKMLYKFNLSSTEITLTIYGSVVKRGCRRIAAANQSQRVCDDIVN